MKLSFPHGLLVISESNFCLYTPNMLGRNVFIATPLDTQTDVECIDQETFDPLEVEEDAFTHSIASLKNEWPARYLDKGGNVKKWQILLPDHWFSFVEKPLPHIGSDYLLSLSSLSIISETIRLSPERLCYGYQCADTQLDLFHIYGCPLDWLNRLSDIMNVEIVGISPYSMHSKYDLQDIRILPVLEPYQPLKWWLKKQKMLVRQLALFSLLIGCIGLSTLYWLNERQVQLMGSIQYLKSLYRPLSPPSKITLQFQPLLLSLPNVPPQIRINSLFFEKNTLMLDLHASKHELEAFLQEQRQQWTLFEWSLLTLPGVNRKALDGSRNQNKNEIVQEVMHAKVLVKLR
ncbi:hypothetical protein [Marinomonas sp. 2405UD68-3]|uniref:hypothetical protein n=1 Tax=Marinomonas sp. 2405UD68-3 TaxID=3391835 RepID=UPI0039C9D664